MIGRVCPVHGEYSATGACRWCESKPVTLLDVALSGPKVRPPPVAEATPWAGGRQVPAEEIADAIQERRFDEPLTYMGAKVVLDRSVSGFVDAVPILVSWPKESAAAKAIREYHATSGVERPLGSTLRRYSTSEGVASHAAFWEAKLATEHAALRWERVARRWNYKHRRPGGLDEEGRRYVWRWWLEKANWPELFSGEPTP